MSPLRPVRSQRGFTLFEMMIVVAILGILLTMGVPLVNRVRHREPLNQAVRDLFEVCSNARARAILQGRVVEVFFQPRARTFQVADGARPPVQTDDLFGAAPEGTPPPAPPGSGLSGRFPNEVALLMLDVNLTEYKDEDFARVRFFPNGTCDEMTVVLRSEKGEDMKVSLEITTGLATAGPVDR